MRCEGCPWGGGLGTVRSPERKSSSGIAIIGEGPAREEVAQGQCFVGPSGMELDRTLAHAGIARREVAIENAFACWKPKNAKPYEEVRAVESCRARTLEFVNEVQPRGLLLLGGRALRSIVPGFVSNASSDGLMRHRGSLWHREEVRAACSSATGWSIPDSVEWIMATIHPAAIIRRERLERFPAMGYRAIPSLDLRRLREALKKGRNLLPIEQRVGLPKLSEITRGFVFDLETSRQSGKPEMIGVQALRGGPVWQSRWSEASSWALEAFRLPVLKVGHNIHGFDMHVLESEGVSVVEPVADTMVLAGMCEPDMARGLYFQQALYLGHRRPYHKELSGANFTKRDEVQAQTALRRAWRATGMLKVHGDEDIEWFYNALDVDSTRLVYNDQIARAQKEGWL